MQAVLDNDSEGYFEAQIISHYKPSDIRLRKAISLRHVSDHANKITDVSTWLFFVPPHILDLEESSGVEAGTKSTVNCLTSSSNVRKWSYNRITYPAMPNN